MFNVTLNYTDTQGKTKSLSKPYECFVDDPFRLNRHFKIDYSIFLLNYSDVKVECQIDGGATLIYEESDNIEISLEKGENCGVLINGESILQDKNNGTYTLKAILSYKIMGEVITREKSLTFSVVPSGLYINVRSNVDVLYDDINLLETDILNGVNKYISQGSSLLMYCKVFEGTKDGEGNTYNTTFTAYNANIENGNIVGWESIGVEETEHLKEQEESIKGVSLTFPTEGIKKIIISTTGMKTNIGVPQYFEKYVYVKKFENKCDWFNSTRHKCISDSYFKANQGDETYSKDDSGDYTFPSFSSGNGILSLTKSSDIITIDQSNFIPKEAFLCTVITFGVQISNINSESAKIVDVYTASSATAPVYSLKLDSLFSDDGSNKIAIPTEVLNKNDNSKYHLVQIIRNLSNLENGVSPIYEDSLYIDGLLESSDASTATSPSKVSKIILQNINAFYNLIL